MTALDSASDALLARRAADGDEAAFAVIVRRHAALLRAFATRLVSSSADADDAVQDALITAWERIGELDDPSKLRSWLLTIVSRKATDRARSTRPTDPLDEWPEPVSTADAGPEAMAETSEQLTALRGVLDALPDEQRQVWVLKEMGGLSYDEIGERLGVTATAVRGRLARARAAVLEQMTAWR